MQLRAAGVDAIRVCGRPNLRRDAAAANISANGPGLRMLRSSWASARAKAIRPRRRGQQRAGHAREFLALRIRPSRLGPRGGNCQCKYVHPEHLVTRAWRWAREGPHEPGVGNQFQGKGEQLAYLPSLTGDPVLRVGANYAFGPRPRA